MYNAKCKMGQDILRIHSINIIVIDYHLEWCGPCQVIEPNYRGMYFNIEEAPSRIEFLTVSIMFNYT